MIIPKKIRECDNGQDIKRTALTRLLIKKPTHSSVKLDCDLCLVSDFVAIIDVISHGTEAVVCITKAEVIIAGIRRVGFNDNRMVWIGSGNLTQAIGFTG
jgi:hypothetical protein